MKKLFSPPSLILLCDRSHTYVKILNAHVPKQNLERLHLRIHSAQPKYRTQWCQLQNAVLCFESWFFSILQLLELWLLSINPHNTFPVGLIYLFKFEGWFPRPMISLLLCQLDQHRIPCLLLQSPMNYTVRVWHSSVRYFSNPHDPKFWTEPLRQFIVSFHPERHDNTAQKYVHRN